MVPGLLLGGLAALAAAAFDGTQRLDAQRGVVVSSSRVLGLAGAYAAVAEGLDGAASNPAAVAHRDRHLDRGWDWDFVAAWYLPQPGVLSRQDPTNDGHTWGRLSGAANVHLGLSGQLGRLGAGLVMTSWQLDSPIGDGSTARVSTGDVALHVGWAGWDEGLLLGASLAAAVGSVDRIDPSGRTTSRAYGGPQVRAGLLYRPRGLPFRLGLSASPASQARPGADPGLPFATPTAFSFPARVSAGVAFWIGPGAWLFNEPSPAAQRQLGLEPVRSPADEARTPVLLSVELDVVGPSRNAVGFDALLPQGDGSGGGLAGRRTSLVARAGAEWELLAHRLALRGGSWLEPSRNGAPLRPHAAFGADLRFTLLWDFRVGVAGDLASRYQNVTLSLGLWRNAGPERTPGG